MRIHTTNNMDLYKNNSFILYPSQTMDFSDLLYKEFAKSNYSVPLNKHDSFSSVSTADSPQSESPREGSSPSYKSKHQSNLERRHKNFQVKKKTELCKTFLLGLTCQYGSKCSFAHGYDELRGKVFVPNNYKTIRCKQFHELGYCNYGPRCQFVHKSGDKEENPPTVSIQYKDIYEGMLSSSELNSLNSSQDFNFSDTSLDEKISLESFGFRRLPIFEACEEF